MGMVEALVRLVIALVGIAALAGASPFASKDAKDSLLLLSVVALWLPFGGVAMRRELISIQSLVGVFVASGLLAASKSLTEQNLQGGIHTGPFGREFISHVAWGLALALCITLIQYLYLKKDRSLRRAFGIGAVIGALSYASQSSAIDAFAPAVQTALTAITLLSPILASVIIFVGTNLGNRKRQGVHQVHPT